jgi:eukaryotic-like serine/threonine-protein kinase
MTGEVVAGKYRIEKLLGRGGMGAVYEAVNLDTEREVALKVLHAEFASRPDVYERFRLEARAAARINHPGVVEVLDFGSTAEGLGYLVMERMQGRPLDVVLRSHKRLSLRDALPLFIDILQTLRAAHANDIVHRDLKPANVFLTRGTPSRTKLLDFGISKFQRETQDITQTGVVLGTLSYMAPEQLVDSKTVTAAADLWAIGAMLFRALTGKPAFTGETDSLLIAQVLTTEALRVREVAPELPVEASALVDPLLCRDAAQRPSLEVLLKNLERVAGQLASPPLGTVIDSLLDGVEAKPETYVLDATTTPSSRPNQPPAAVVTTVVPPQPAPRSSRRWVGTVAVGLMLVTALVLIMGNAAKRSTAGTPGPLEASPVRVLEPVVVNAPNAASATAANVAIRVTTKPASATVTVDGEFCGSPCRLEGLVGERRTIVAGADGYQSKSIEYRFDQGEALLIELERALPARRAAPSREKGPPGIEVDKQNPYR